MVCFNPWTKKNNLRQQYKVTQLRGKTADLATLVMLLNNYVQTQSIPNFAFLTFISIVEYRVDRNHCWTWTRAPKTTVTLCISTLPTMLSVSVICFRTKCFPHPWKKSTLLYRKLFPGPILHVDYSVTWILLLIIWHDPGFFFWNSSRSCCHCSVQVCFT